MGAHAPSDSPGAPPSLPAPTPARQILFWDVRSGAAPVMRIEAAHGAHDVHCVDWNRLDPQMVATGERG